MNDRTEASPPPQATCNVQSVARVECEATIPLPSTASAAAEALAKIVGAPLDVAACAALNAENAALLDTSPAGLMPSLARNLVVMQTLSTKLIGDAYSTKNESARAALLKTAMAASKEAREIIEMMRVLKAEARAEDARIIDGGGA